MKETGERMNELLLIRHFGINPLGRENITIIQNVVIKACAINGKREGAFIHKD